MKLLAVILVAIIVIYVAGFLGGIEYSDNTYERGFNDAMNQRVFISTPDTNIKFNLEWKMIKD